MSDAEVIVRAMVACICCGAAQIQVRNGNHQSMRWEPECSCFRGDTPKHEQCGRCRLHCECASACSDCAASVALGKLSMALGNPCLEMDAEETIEDALVRYAIQRLTVSS